MEPIRRYTNADLSRPGAEDPIRYAARYIRDNIICPNVGTSFSQGDNAPLSWLRKAVQSGVGCANPTLPPSQGSVPTAAGKCAGAQYRVLVRYTGEQRSGNNWAPVANFNAINALGAITNVRYVKNATNGTRQWFCDTGVGTGITQNNVPIGPGLLDDFANDRRNFQWFVEIDRLPLGTPDICPNPLPTYPDPPNRTDPNPPPAFSVPRFIPIPVGIGIFAPVIIKPNFTLNGNINFRIADSIDINFNVDGVDIYINPEVNIDLFPNAPAPEYQLPPGYPDPPTGNNGSDGADSGDLDTRFDSIEDKLDRLEECACSDQDEFQTTVGDSFFGNNGTINLTADVVAISVELVEKPETPKLEWGGGEAPDVYYAGWASYSSYQGQLSRNPIDYEVKTFSRPKESDKFTWTCRQFYRARVTPILRVPGSTVR